MGRSVVQAVVCLVVLVGRTSALVYRPGLLTRSSTSQGRRRLPDLRAESKNVAMGTTEAQRRMAVLVSVPMVWGTYAPCVKLVYQLPSAQWLMERAPDTFSVGFSAAYYVVAATALGVARLASREATASTESSTAVDVAGLELGMYLFLGNCLQVVGLQTTSADAAAFLVQLTTVIVPALEALVTGTLASRTRTACLVAFAGVAVICGGDVGSPSAAAGDAFIVLAAVVYSLHVVRLSAVAADFRPLDLAFSKAKAETLFSLVSFAACVAAYSHSDSTLLALSLPAGAENDLPTALLVVLWCGLVTCAYTIFAQSYGQRGNISAASANLIYTTQPIFSALFAAILVHEQPTPFTLLGGALILGAVLYDLQGRFSTTHDDDDDPLLAPPSSSR